MFAMLSGDLQCPVAQSIGGAVPDGQPIRGGGNDERAQLQADHGVAEGVPVDPLADQAVEMVEDGR